MHLSLAAVFIIFTIILFLYSVCIFDIFIGRNITMDNFFTTYLWLKNFRRKT